MPIESAMAFSDKPKSILKRRTAFPNKVSRMVFLLSWLIGFTVLLLAAFPHFRTIISKLEDKSSKKN